MVMYRGGRPMINDDDKIDTRFKDDEDQKIISVAEENDMMRLNLERMQRRVMELERVCKGMKGQMSRKGKINGRSPLICQAQTKAVPRFC